MKNDPLVIRPFDKATDIAPLSAVWFDASLAAHPFLGRARLLEQRKLIEDLYLPSSETWVACRHDTPVGFISLLDGFIGGLFVSPGCQGQGRPGVDAQGHPVAGCLYAQRTGLCLLHGAGVPGTVPAADRRQRTAFRTRAHAVGVVKDRPGGASLPGRTCRIRPDLRRAAP